jgi:hypothetical protein
MKKEEKEIAQGNRTDLVTQLAIQIADGAASCDIETLCLPVGGEPSNIEEIRECWFDLYRLSDPSDAGLVWTSAEYLACRGLLARHPANANWVRPLHVATWVKVHNDVDA